MIFGPALQKFLDFELNKQESLAPQQSERSPHFVAGPLGITSNWGRLVDSIKKAQNWYEHCMELRNSQFETSAINFHRMNGLHQSEDA